MRFFVSAILAFFTAVLVAAPIGQRPVTGFGVGECSFKLHKLALLREIEDLLVERPGDPLDVRRSVRFARYAIRNLIEVDAVSVSAVESLRNALRREPRPARALATLREYQIIQGLARMQGIRVPEPRLVPLARVPNPHGAATTYALSAGAEHLFLGSRRGLEIWRPGDGRRAHGLDGELAGAQAATFGATGDHLFVTFRERIGFVSWSASDGEKRFSGLRERALSAAIPPRALTADVIAVSSDSTQVATASWNDSRVFLWSLASQQGRWIRLPGESIEGVASLRWSRNGRRLLVAAFAPGKVWSIDVATNAIEEAVAIPFEDVAAATFGESDRTVVALGENRGRVAVIDFASGRIERDFPTGLGEGAALSPDGRFVAGARAVGATQRLELWSVRHGNLAHVEVLREGVPQGVFFSADARFVAVVLKEGTRYPVQTFRLEGFELD